MLNFPLNGVKLKCQMWVESKSMWVESNSMWVETNSMWAESNSMWVESNSMWAESNSMWAGCHLAGLVTEHGDESALLCLDPVGHLQQQAPLAPWLRDLVGWYPATAGVAPHVITGGEGDVPGSDHVGGGGQTGGGPAHRHRARVSQVGHCGMYQRYIIFQQHTP